MAGSWFQHPQAGYFQRWAGLGISNAGSVAKDNDHVLVDGRWRMHLNCRIYWSAQFFNTDQSCYSKPVKLQLKSRRIVPSQPRLDVGKLKDGKVAEEFVNRLSGDMGVWVFWGILKICGVPSRLPSLMLRWLSWNTPSGEEELSLPTDT